MEKQNLNIANDAQQCFNKIFTKSFRKNEEDYVKALADMAIYLAGEACPAFDEIVKQYNGVDKTMLLQMCFSNFIEINYYRQKNGIVLDADSKGILDSSINNKSSNCVGIIGLYLSITQLVKVINDCLLYFWHPSKIYSYNAVNTLIEDNITENLYHIYPYAMQEHLHTLENTYTDKEFLLHTLIECITNKGEKVIYEAGNSAIPLGYEQGIANILKEHNGSDPDKENLHQQVLEEFKEKTGITSGPDYDKILLLEMVVAACVLKNDFLIPLSDSEEKIVYQIGEKLEPDGLTIDSLSAIYDENEREIISILINDWHTVNTRVMLNDMEGFDKPKEKSSAFVKKRFTKETENK